MPGYRVYPRASARAYYTAILPIRFRPRFFERIGYPVSWENTDYWGRKLAVYLGF